MGAQLPLEAAGVSCLVLLYTLLVPLYSLWQMSDQDCCCSKKVLHTIDMQVTIRGVTSSWGSTKQAAVDARRAETVQCCDYYLSLWHYYFTYFIHYRHYYKTRIWDFASSSTGAALPPHLNRSHGCTPANPYHPIHQSRGNGCALFLLDVIRNSEIDMNLHK